MGNAALAYDYYEEIPDEQIELPAGGIANFLNATEGDWATEDDIPHAGIAKVQSVANELAKYGRYEDEYMVHAAHGETVVPMAVLDANPRLKKSLYSQMESMGLEPGRYVVGDELNSINPVTGQPEFFLKKLFKGLKKIVKKVFKVVVPIVATAFLAPIMGVVGASALVSGASTLVQGGSLKDALKSAALGGLTAGVFKGIEGGIASTKAGGKFFEGFGKGFKGSFTPGDLIGPKVDEAARAEIPVETASPETNKIVDATERALISPDVDPINVQPIESGVQEGFTSLTGDPRMGTPLGPVGGDISAPTQFSGEAVTSGAVSGPGVVTPSAPTPAPLNVSTPVVNVDPGFGVGPQPIGGPPSQQITPVGSAGSAGAAGAGAAAAGGSTLGPVPETGFFANLKAAFTKDTLGPGGTDLGFKEGLMNAFLPQFSANMKDQYAQNVFGKNFMDLSAEQMKEVATKMSSTLTPIRSYAPMVAGITALSAFSTPEQEELASPFEEVDPRKFVIPFGRPTTFDITRTEGNYVPTPTPPGAQDGGDISYFPRRNGAISGPGTETSDDIPAMLSDGEFVMTAKAVRGAGNGSRKQGMQNMYSMMRNFEANA